MAWESISFSVDGEPVGKARPRITKHGAYTPQKTRDYQAKVRAAFIAAASWEKSGMPDIDKVLTARVRITAVFGIPQSWSKRKKQANYGAPVTKKPDVDNVAKAVCDALNGVAYRDDSCIVALTVGKRYVKNDSEQPHVAANVALATQEDPVDGA